jgi:hypothetical protein
MKEVIVSAAGLGLYLLAGFGETRLLNDQVFTEADVSLLVLGTVKEFLLLSVYPYFLVCFILLLCQFE